MTPRHCSPALVTAALLAAAASLGQAQERPDTAALTPVVVTATRVAGGERSPTAAATVLSGELLRERGVVTIAEALETVPGVTIAQSGSIGGTTSLFLRGGENDYVQVLVDGVAINEPGGYVDLASLTTENIDRIEIVRGPVSVLYGSEAVTGVVQIFTRSGRDARRATAGVRVGSFHTLDADAAVTGSRGPASWSLSGARYGTDGILDFNNDYRNEVASALVQVTHPRRGDARLSARYSNGTFHFPTDAGGVPFDSNQYSFEKRLIVGGEFGRPLSEHVEARLLVASSDVDAGAVDEPDNATVPFRTRSGRESYRRSGDARLLFRLSPAMVLSTGAQLEWERERTLFRSEDLSTSPPGSFESRDDGRRWNRAYYAQAVGTARSLFSYSAGVRLEDDQHFGNYTTYRLGTGARVAAATRLRAAVGKGFKRPLFYEITGGGFAAPNPALQPERSTSWEAGIDQALAGDRLELGGTWFDQRFRDLIQYTPAPSPAGAARYENLAKVRASGAELEARLRPTSVVRLDLGYTYLRTDVEDAGADLAGATYAPGKRLLRRPTHTGTAAASWRVLPPLALHASVLRVGDRDDRRFAGFTSTRVTLPSYTKVDLAAEYTAPRFAPRAPDLAFTLRLDNVLDRRYESIAGFRSPGRMVALGARLGLDL